MLPFLQLPAKIFYLTRQTHRPSQPSITPQQAGRGILFGSSASSSRKGLRGETRRMRMLRQAGLQASPAVLDFTAVVVVLLKDVCCWLLLQGAPQLDTDDTSDLIDPSPSTRRPKLGAKGRGRIYSSNRCPHSWRLQDRVSRPGSKKDRGTPTPNARGTFGIWRSRQYRVTAASRVETGHEQGHRLFCQRLIRGTLK